MAESAWLITFTTYGSWLHGDERGSWRRTRTDAGGGLVAENPLLRDAEVARLSHPPVQISSAMRAVLTVAFPAVCERRGWLLLAVNIRMTHVHAVVSADDRPEAVMQALKAHGTRFLRQHGLVPHDARVWTRHGSTRYLPSAAAVEAAVDYVANRQGSSLPGSSTARRQGDERG